MKKKKTIVTISGLHALWEKRMYPKWTPPLMLANAKHNFYTGFMVAVMTLDWTARTRPQSEFAGQVALFEKEFFDYVEKIYGKKTRAKAHAVIRSMKS